MNILTHKTSGVYAIVNKADGKRYVGSSWNIESRWKKHISLLNAGKHHSIHLQRAWNKYGAKNFDFVILVACLRTDLLIYEQDYLDSCNPEYNVCVTAGSKAGTPRSLATRLKLAIANLGERHTIETRQKMSMSHKANGWRPSEETKRKISVSHTGVSKGAHTAKAKQKISAALKGKPLSDKNKQGIANAMKGNTNTVGKHWTWKKK